MASVIDMFVASFGRAPTPQESTWLVKWQGSISSGEVTMQQVGEVMGLSPQVTVNGPMEPNAPEDGEALGSVHVELSHVDTLLQAFPSVYGRQLDIPTLHHLLVSLDGSEGKDVAQLLVEYAQSDVAFENDKRLLEAQSKSAIDYLKEAGWDGYQNAGGVQSVAGITRESVIEPENEPHGAIAFTEERWAYFTSVRDQLAVNGEARVEDVAVDTLRLLEPLRGDALAFSVRDSLAVLVDAPEWMRAESASYQLTDAADAYSHVAVADALSADYVQVLNGASNRESYVYRIVDSLNAIVGAQPNGEDAENLVAMADAYALSDDASAFSGLAVDQALTSQQLQVLNGAENRESYVYRIVDSLNAIVGAQPNGEDAESGAENLVALADAYALTDDASAFNGLALSQALTPQQLQVLNGTENRESYHYRIADTLEALEALFADSDSFENADAAANAAELRERLESADDYVLSNSTDAFLNIPVSAITPQGWQIMQGAANADDFVITLSDTLENILAAPDYLRENAESYRVTDAPADFEGIAVADITPEMIALWQEASNASAFNLVLADSAEAILAAPDIVLETASAYAFTDNEAVTLTPQQHLRLEAFFDAEANAGQYVVSGSASELVGIRNDGAELGHVAGVIHEGARGTTSEGVSEVVDTFVLGSSGGVARIMDFEVGSQHDLLDVSAFFPVSWGVPNEEVRFGYLDELPETLGFDDFDDVPEVLALSESFLPSSASSLEDAVAQALQNSEGESLQIARDESAIFDTVTNRKIIAIAEDNVDGGVATLWLWEEDDNSSSFDGRVQASELTQLATLVGISDADLANSITSDYFI